jgi:hypothetical protein
MNTLTIVAFIVTAAIIAMGIYTKSHPPDASELGVQRLRIGLRLGTASSATILLIFVLMICFPGPFLAWNLLLVLLGVAGNIVNLLGVVDCLRELNGESLFAALLLIFSQLLWILYVVRVMFSDF